MSSGNFDTDQPAKTTQADLDRNFSIYVNFLHVIGLFYLRIQLDLGRKKYFLWCLVYYGYTLTLYHTILTLKSFENIVGKGKMLVTSIFSFSNNGFYPSQNKYQFFSHLYFVVCKCSQFGPIWNFVVRWRGKPRFNRAFFIWMAIYFCNRSCFEVHYRVIILSVWFFSTCQEISNVLIFDDRWEIQSCWFLYFILFHFFNPFFKDCSNLKESADDIFRYDENSRKFSKRVENTVGKRRNCSLRAISPFPTVFSKDLYCRHVKTRACLGKG